MFVMRPIFAGALATACVAAIAGATPAQAQPIPTAGSASGDTFIADCSAFQVFDQYVTNWSGIIKTDSSGAPIGVVQRLWGSDRLYNSVTGKSVSDTVHSGEQVDFIAGTATGTGNTFRVVLPGLGTVFVDVGRIVIDFSSGPEFAAGQHQYFGLDFAQLCAVLS